MRSASKRPESRRRLSRMPSKVTVRERIGSMRDRYCRRCWRVSLRACNQAASRNGDRPMEMQQVRYFVALARDAELHARGRAVQRQPAGPDPRHPAAGARARRSAVPPRARQHAFVRTWADDAALSADGRGKHPGRARPGPRGQEARARDADDRDHVHHRPAAGFRTARPLPGPASERRSPGDRRRRAGR